MPFENVPAEESASQGKERLVNVGALFVANTQTPELIHPSEGPFNDPPPSAQSATMLSVAFREPRHDVAGPQASPDCLRVITTVA
jgi:hypothetical protein